MNPQLVPSDPSQADPSIVALMAGLKSNEGGTNYNALGDKNNEGQYTAAGIGQWSNQVNGVPQALQKGQIPANFQNDAKQYGLDPNDFSPANQNKVIYAVLADGKINKHWTPEQELSAWNSGDPNKYLSQDASGTGPVGAYNVATYVDKGMKAAQAYAQKTKGQIPQPGSDYNPAPFSNPNPGAVNTTGTSIPTSDSTSSQSTSLTGELVNRVEQGSKAASQGIADAGNGNITGAASGLLQTVGAGAGAINDVVGAGLNLIPGVKSVEGLIGKGVGAVANTSAGQEAIGAGESFAAKHPELAADIGAAGNILGAAGTFEGVGAAKDVIGGAIAKGIGKDVVSSTVADVAPDLSGKAAAGAVAKGGATKNGLLGTVKQAATPADIKVAQAVDDAIPNFSKLSTFTDKVNATRDAVSSMADKLQKAVVTSGKDRIYPFQELSKAIDGVDMPIAIKSDPVLERQFGLAKDAALKIAKDNGGKISNLFDARKEFDELVAKQFPTLYERTNAPMRDAITGVRGAMNDFIESHLPEGSGFKESLQQQSRLFKAIDNMAPKAAKEVGTNAITRVARAHPRVAGLLKYGGTALAGGLGLGEVQNLLSKSSGN